jgi:hypothetical protein
LNQARAAAFGEIQLIPTNCEIPVHDFPKH